VSPAAKQTTHRVGVGEIALALANRHSEPVCTVKLGRTSSGDVTIQVDVDDADVRAAEKLATQVYDRLARKYPRAKS
jgi:hypothetical protein